MFGMIKSLFSSGNSIGKIVKGGVQLADDYILTKEEDADLFLKYIEATLPSNVARRILAIAVTAVWVETVQVMIVLAVVDAVRETNYSAGFVDPVLYVSGVFGTVLSWYFWKGVKGSK